MLARWGLQHRWRSIYHQVMIDGEPVTGIPVKGIPVDPGLYWASDVQLKLYLTSIKVACS